MQKTLQLSVALLASALCTHAGSFIEASKYLDTDGSILGYIDFEGDGEAIGTQLNAIYGDALASVPGMMPVPIDFPTLFDNLGFGSIRSIGISSKELEQGTHVNRSVVLLDGEPAGLMALYGDRTSPESSFTAAELAPADATGAISGTVQLGAIRDTTIAVLTQVMGPMGEGLAQQQLAQVIPGTDITADEVIQALSGRWDAFWHESYSDEFIPSYKAWIQVAGAASVVERLKPLAEGLPLTISETESGLLADFSAMLGTENIGLFVETSNTDSSLTIYTHKDWGPESDGPRLSATEGYQAISKNLPETALIYSYSGGYDMSTIFSAFAAEPMIANYSSLAEKLFDMLLGDFLKPAVSATYFAEDAMVSELYAGYSMKQAIVLLPAAGGGLMAAMAVPAFQKVRTTSQEKAITNNLRQIAAAGQQYILENGVSEAPYEKLVGDYFPPLKPVTGETYDDIVISDEGGQINVELPDGQVISYEY